MKQSVKRQQRLYARLYDPNNFRFVSPDQPEFVFATPDGLIDKNLYAYCFNNPVMFTDIEGTYAEIMKTICKNITEWVGNNIVDPVSQFVDDIKTDIDNYDTNNTDVNKVYESWAASVSAKYFKFWRWLP